VSREHDLKNKALALEKLGFELLEKSGPDTEHFGNWILIGVRDNLALRLICDRGPEHLDLMPADRFRATQAWFFDSAGNRIEVPSSQSDWYNWDVVASALGIPYKPEIEPLVSLQEYLEQVNHFFGPANWEWTRERLAQVEQEKRRRFTEGHGEERRVPTHA
jgi:hypothetical protein